MNNIQNPSHSITINNRRIYDFYQEHPNLNIEQMNLYFITIMEQMIEKTNSSGADNYIKLLATKLQTFEENLSYVTNSMTKFQSDVSTSLTLKLSEFKKEYLEEIKLLLSVQTNTTTDKLKDQNSSIIDKIHIMLNNIIPKNDEIIYKPVQDYLKEVQRSIMEDTKKIISSSLTKESLNDFSKQMESKINNMMIQSQNLMNSLITSTEQRIDTKISDVKNNLTEIKTISSSNQDSQSQLQTNVSNLLKKMENSNLKGKISENILYNLLKALYPYAQIEVVGTQKETGDIILKRKNKPTILIENKNYNKNILQDEVKKFIRDVEIQNCCGLFLSQNFSIANKENYEINFHNQNVLVYVEEVNNDPDKIKAGIDIIDQIKMKMDELSNEKGVENIHISKETLSEINKEFQYYQSQKLIQIKTIKESFQKILKQQEEDCFIHLEKLLSNKYAFSTNKIICEFCEDYVAKNQSALSAHQRHCKNKPFIQKQDHDQDQDQDQDQEQEQDQEQKSEDTSAEINVKEKTTEQIPRTQDTEKSKKKNLANQPKRKKH